MPANLQTIFYSISVTTSINKKLPIGTPFSGVLACRIIEFLDSGPFISILHQTLLISDTDNFLLIYPQKTILTDFVDQLNSVEPAIGFHI